MRRDLGGALIGALLFVVGLALRSTGTYEVEVVGGVALLGGGLVALICLAKVGVSLMSSARTP